MTISCVFQWPMKIRLDKHVGVVITSGLNEVYVSWRWIVAWVSISAFPYVQIMGQLGQTYWCLTTFSSLCNADMELHWITIKSQKSTWSVISRFFVTTEHHYITSNCGLCDVMEHRHYFDVRHFLDRFVKFIWYIDQNNSGLIHWSMAVADWYKTLEQDIAKDLPGAQSVGHPGRRRMIRSYFIIIWLLWKDEVVRYPKGPLRWINIGKGHWEKVQHRHALSRPMINSLGCTL